MTLLSWDIPLISFNGSLWEVLLRCSKWLLGAWLDSFTMILRCWLVVWVKWARPLVSMTLWSRVMFNWKAVQLKGRPIHGPSYTIESQWGKFSTPPAPRGATFTPFWGMVLQSLPASFKCGKISHFCEIHSLSYEASVFFAMLSQWGKFGTLLPPRGATFTPFWGMVLQSLPASWNVANFTFLWNPLSELRGVKVFLNVKSMLWFCPYFAPGANIVPPIAYKSHSTRFPIRPHVLTPHSGSVTKTVGGVARRNKSGRRRRRRIISMSNNNTVLCH